MNAQAITIKWRSPPPFELLAPFREVQTTRLPPGTEWVPMDSPRVVAAVALADVIRTITTSLAMIVEHSPDPAARMAVLHQVYQGGAARGIEELDQGEIRPAHGPGRSSLAIAIRENADRALSTQAAMALAAQTGAAWLSALLVCSDPTNEYGKQALLAQCHHSRAETDAAADEVVKKWRAKMDPARCSRPAMPVLRPDPSGPCRLAILPAGYEPRLVPCLEP